MVFSPLFSYNLYSILIQVRQKSHFPSPGEVQDPLYYHATTPYPYVSADHSFYLVTSLGTRVTL